MITASDLVAIVIALGTAITLIITTALANHRLDKSRKYWHSQYEQLKRETDLLEAFNDPNSDIWKD